MKQPHMALDNLIGPIINYHLHISVKLDVLFVRKIQMGPLFAHVAISRASKNMLTRFSGIIPRSLRAA